MAFSHPNNVLEVNVRKATKIFNPNLAFRFELGARTFADCFGFTSNHQLFPSAKTLQGGKNIFAQIGLKVRPRTNWFSKKCLASLFFNPTGLLQKRRS